MQSLMSPRSKSERATQCSELIGVKAIQEKELKGQRRDLKNPLRSDPINHDSLNFRPEMADSKLLKVA
jgi:hypothetical protein